MDVAVLLMTYKRYGTTRIVFDAIRKAKPKKIYIASNGPICPDDVSETKQIQKIRRLTSDIDWECDVKTLFRENHLSVEESIPNSINWFFSHETEGIILEDDCVPGNTFFEFCSELLNYHRHNHQIMMISGNNFQDGIVRTNKSYYYSGLFHIWGWATWKRAWEKYEYSKNELNSKSGFNEIQIPLKKYSYRLFWKRVLLSVKNKKLNTWDHIWTYCCWSNNGLSCIPHINLVSNIGFGEEATFTFNINDKSSNMSVEEINFPLLHNNIVKQNLIADEYTCKNHYKISKIKEIIKYLINNDSK